MAFRDVILNACRDSIVCFTYTEKTVDAVEGRRRFSYEECKQESSGDRPLQAFLDEARGGLQ